MGYAAMEELVPVYNVRLDVGNSKDTADFFQWVSRPAVPAEDRGIVLEDVLCQLRTKINKLPDDALRGILEFLTEVHEKLQQVQNDMRYRETKLDPETITDLQQKDSQVVQMIGLLTSKVGYVQRGNVIVSGGLTPGASSWGSGVE